MAKSEEQFQSEVQAQSKLANLYKVKIRSLYLLGKGEGVEKYRLGLT